MDFQGKTALITGAGVGIGRAVALKMAEGAVCRQTVGEEPVYLFDDVLSELDEGRRRVLVDGTEHKQFLITACDKSAYAGEAHCILTEGGRYVSSYR
jgi:recombinational DNA repair ATPase RecF